MEVLRQALGQLNEWRRAELVGPGFTVSVNLSPRQLLEPDLVGTVNDALVAFGLQPSDLVLEMTETTLMSERSTMADAVSGLAELGVALSIDDFGTGYSSLSYLRCLRCRSSRSTGRSCPRCPPVPGTLRWSLPSSDWRTSSA